MKVTCDCGTEMHANEDEHGVPTNDLSLARIYVLGELRHEIRGIWYHCSGCSCAATLMPHFPYGPDKEEESK